MKEVLFDQGNHTVVLETTEENETMVSLSLDGDKFWETEFVDFEGYILACDKDTHEAAIDYDSDAYYLGSVGFLVSSRTGELFRAIRFGSGYNVEVFDIDTGRFTDKPFKVTEYEDCMPSYQSIVDQVFEQCAATRRFFYRVMMEKYNVCEHCGRFVREDYHTFNGDVDIYLANGELAEHICRDCVGYITWHCDVCNHDVLGRSREVDVTFEGDHVTGRICQHCFENIRESIHLQQCENCDIYVSDDRWHSDGCMCDDCTERHQLESLIHRWNYKPTPLFTDGLAQTNYDPTYGVRYIGMEIEVDKGERTEFVVNCHKAAKEKGYQDLFYFMHDGSLQNSYGEVTGVEVTTVPLALDFALNGFPFEFLHKQCIKYKMASHNTKTCGLHIHINKDSIPNYDRTMAKVLLAFDKFYTQFCQFGRRISKDEARRWADRPRANIAKVDSMEMLRRKIENSGYNHYKAVNLSPRDTVEFRLWKGTHNPDTLRAHVDFNSAIIDVCAETSLENLYDMVWADFVRAILPHIKLDKTVDYIKHRGLMEEI